MMATQQGAPPRPWFRLATMVRPPPSAAPNPQPDQSPPPSAAPNPQPGQSPPPQPPAPRSAFIRPAFSQTFRAPPPPSPPVAAANVATTKPPAARDTSKEPSPMPLQQSGLRSAVTTSPPPTNITRPATPTSPNIKQISRTPSPLALPPPQLKPYNGNQPEYEQKTVLVQETKENPKNHNPKPNTPKKPETPKKHLDSDQDNWMRVITIAGHNKGAIMDLIPFDKKSHDFGNNPHRLVKKDNPTATSSDAEKSGSNSDGKSKEKNNNRKPKSPLMNAIMNSNVQGVNNSLLYNSSTTHHDPGVHFSLSKKPNGGHRF